MTNRITAILACALIAASGCTTTIPGSATAGGEIGSGLTTAKPRPTSIEGQQACTMVDEDVVAKVGFHDIPPQPARNNWGSLCTYQHEDVRISALLTDGPNQGLAELRPHPQAKVTTTAVGAFPARLETIGGSCEVIVELVPGRALRIDYYDPGGGPAHRCARAHTLTVEAIAGIPQ
jgi:hypothetical protein